MEASAETQEIYSPVLLKARIPPLVSHGSEEQNVDG